MTESDEGLSGDMVPVRNIPIEWVRALLNYANLSDRIDKRVDLIASVHHVTSGSEKGLEVALEWAKKWDDYPGAEMITRIWQSWCGTDIPHRFATLCEHVEANGFEWIDICSQTEPGFEPIEDVSNDSIPVNPTKEPPHPLVRYSLIDDLGQLQLEASNYSPFLHGLALQGQATVFFAAPNSGKTLITVRSLCDDIGGGRLVPSKLFYLNLDDSFAGLLEKLSIAKAYGFHMISDGFRGFRSTDFPALISALVAERHCEGVVIVIDVLKKLVDVMNKGESTSFGKLIRAFVLRGGTCIALAHTNKRRNADGKPIYAGTSDILEDFDCAYLMYEIATDPRTTTKTVLFENRKSRGNVRKQATFTYSIKEGLSYEELFESVVAESDVDIPGLQEANTRQSDSELIEIASACIAEGISTKMLLAATVAERSGCSKKAAHRLLKRYSGNNPKNHRWTFQIGPRGAKIFALLPTDPSRTQS